MKIIISVLSICMAAAMMLSLCACGKSAGTDATATTSASTAATTPSGKTGATAATATRPAATQANGAANSAGSAENSGQNDATSAGQQDDAARQNAVQNAVEKAESLYGEGDWRVASVEETTDQSGEPCYYVGLINYSNSQSPTYYFYSSDKFCTPDSNNENAAQGSGSNEQNNDSDKQQVLQNVIASATQIYGEGDWRAASFQEATTSDGKACWYVGVINYSNSQSPTYYFYSGNGFTYPDGEANAGY